MPKAHQLLKEVSPLKVESTRRATSLKDNIVSAREGNMTETAERTTPGAGVSTIVFAAWHDPSARILNVDLLAVVAAALLPWTTTGTAIAMAFWFVAVFFTLDLHPFLRSLSRPPSALPIAFFALVVAGTLWGDAPWSARLHGINPSVKLLAIPFLLYHFERSHRARWVFAAFLISCTLLMMCSGIVLLEPGWRLGNDGDPGVAVKNYVD
jgi:O-antigen ligase